jgi:hypothetical protein
MRQALKSILLAATFACSACGEGEDGEIDGPGTGDGGLPWNAVEAGSFPVQAGTAGGGPVNVGNALAPSDAGTTSDTGTDGSSGDAGSGDGGTSRRDGGPGGMIGDAGKDAAVVDGDAASEPGTEDAGTGCSVTPANPNATKQARNLLCYLYSQYRNHVLSGQQETSWSNPEGDISWYTGNGLKAPAILGGDFLYPNGTTTRAIAYWNAGGITMIRYHMGAPPGPDTYENSKGSANLDNVLREGTAENTSFKEKLDYAAGELEKLQDANVAVLWAPFHEVQANGWFWWSKGSGSQFVALWKYMFDYFTRTKKLNNLVWLLPFSGAPSAAYYPGKDYLDLAGPDTYATDQPFLGMYSTTRNVVGSALPIPLHETGLIPNPADMFPSAAPWVLFNIWATYQSDGTHNTLANIKSVYADSRTVTRDELPNLR